MNKDKMKIHNRKNKNFKHLIKKYRVKNTKIQK